MESKHKKIRTRIVRDMLLMTMVVMSPSLLMSKADPLLAVINKNHLNANAERRDDNLENVIKQISRDKGGQTGFAQESDIAIMDIDSAGNGNNYQWQSGAGPILSSRAALVVNAKTGRVLYQKNDTARMSIASITKLMSAMVFLDAGQNMDNVLTITDADVDYLKKSGSRLAVGTSLTREELLHIGLMSSENRAIHALARNYPGGITAFVRAMNQKARELGMVSSVFYDPTGLDPRNQSTAGDLLKMARAADAYSRIRYYTTDTQTEIVNKNGKLMTYRNSNALVRKGDWNIELQKTGYIKEAGRCMIVKSKIGADDVYLVFLGAPSSYSRVSDAESVRRTFGGEYY